MADIPVLLKRSGVKGKLPNPDNAQYGELFVNYHSSDPMLCFKNNAGEIVQLKPARAIDGGGGEMPPNTGNENGDTIWNGSQLLVWDTDEWIPVGPNDLAYEDAADKGTITNTAGSDVELPVATDAAAGLLSGVDKGKLDGVEAGANANVNADWNAVDGDAEILNKPDIPDAQVQSDWAQADSGAVDFIKNKPAIPDEQVQADWDQATSTEPDFIKNKPTDLGDFTNEPGFITDAGVTSIIAGDNISVDTTTGDVTITATGGGGGGASVDVGETPPDPADATEGDLFWSETSGRLYVFAQGAWIDASPDGGSGEGGGGVTSIIAGDGISVDQATGDVTITNTGGGGSGTPGVRYQQGTWTPEVSQGTVTASNSVWVRNGNQVTVWTTFTEFSDTSNAAVVEVLGNSLPYITDEALRATTQAVGSCYASFIGRKPTSIALTDSNRLRFSSTAEGESKTSLSARYQDIGVGASVRLVVTYTTSDTTFAPGTGATVTTDIQGSGGGGGSGTTINYNGASAWGMIAANGAIEGSHNIKKVDVTGGSSSVYEITFATPMPNANYSVVGSSDKSSGAENKIFGVYNDVSKTVNGFKYYTSLNSDSQGIPASASFAVFASNAIAPQSGVGADCWGNVNADGTKNGGGFNFADVNKVSEGVYDVTFTTPMPNDQYSVTASVSPAGSGNQPVRMITAGEQTTAGFKVITTNGGSIVDGTNAIVKDYPFTFAVFASNAIAPQAGVGADCWGRVSDTATLLGSGFNIGSVERVPGQSTGAYRITFATPMPTEEYSVVMTPVNSQCFGGASSQTKASFDIYIRSSGAADALTNSEFSFTVHASSTITPTYTWTRDGTTVCPANTGDTVTFKRPTDDQAGLVGLGYNADLFANFEPSEPNNQFGIWNESGLGKVYVGLPTSGLFNIVDTDDSNTDKYIKMGLTSSLAGISLGAKAGVGSGNNAINFYIGGTKVGSIKYNGSTAFNLEWDDPAHWTQPLEEGAEPVYNGPTLNSLDVLLELKAKIETLEAAKASLEARLSTLEGGN